MLNIFNIICGREVQIGFRHVFHFLCLELAYQSSKVQSLCLSVMWHSICVIFLSILNFKLWNMGVLFCNTLFLEPTLYFSKRTRPVGEEKNGDNNDSIFPSTLSGFCDVTSANRSKGRWERPRGSIHTRLPYMYPLFHLTLTLS